MKRITHREGLMRVPVEATDPDIVLSDCQKEIDRLTRERDALLEVAQAIEGALRFAPAAEVLDEHSPIRDGLRAALAQAKEA